MRKKKLISNITKKKGGGTRKQVYIYTQELQRHWMDSLVKNNADSLRVGIVLSVGIL